MAYPHGRDMSWRIIRQQILDLDGTDIGDTPNVQLFPAAYHKAQELLRLIREDKKPRECMICGRPCAHPRFNLCAEHLKRAEEAVGQTVHTYTTYDEFSRMGQEEWEHMKEVFRKRSEKYGPHERYPDGRYEPRAETLEKHSPCNEWVVAFHVDMGACVIPLAEYKEMQKLGDDPMRVSLTFKTKAEACEALRNVRRSVMEAYQQWGLGLRGSLNSEYEEM